MQTRTLSLALRKKLSFVPGLTIEPYNGSLGVAEVVQLDGRRAGFNRHGHPVAVTDELTHELRALLTSFTQHTPPFEERGNVFHKARLYLAKQYNGIMPMSVSQLRVDIDERPICYAYRTIIADFDSAYWTSQQQRTEQCLKLLLLEDGCADREFFAHFITKALLTISPSVIGNVKNCTHPNGETLRVFRQQLVELSRSVRSLRFSRERRHGEFLVRLHGPITENTKFAVEINAAENATQIKEMLRQEELLNGLYRLTDYPDLEAKAIELVRVLLAHLPRVGGEAITIRLIDTLISAFRGEFTDEHFWST